MVEDCWLMNGFIHELLRNRISGIAHHFGEMCMKKISIQ